MNMMVQAPCFSLVGWTDPFLHSSEHTGRNHRTADERRAWQVEFEAFVATGF